ncbi:MAG TPA: flagellar protein FlaG [Oxalicibacterium sp.]|nr:flagellar protein FlaG [Oxalicibacterium sp.]
MDIGQINSINNKSGAQPVAAGAATVAPAFKGQAAPVLTSNPVQPTDAVTTASQLATALQSINKALQDLSPNLEFTVDPDSNRTVVKVLDQQTKEVIRQMPSAEALEISKALDKLQGLLVRQKA